MRHDRIRIFIYHQASQVYKDSALEPRLSPVLDEDLPQDANLANDAHSDIRINNFHRDLQNTFLYIKVMNIKASSYAEDLPKDTQMKGEKEKRENIRTGYRRLRTDTLFL